MIRSVLFTVSLIYKRVKVTVMRIGRQTKTVPHFLWNEPRVLIFFKLQLIINDLSAKSLLFFFLLQNDLVFSNNANNGFEIQTVITCNMVKNL